MALVFLDFQIRFDSVNQGGLGFVLILQDAENPLVNGAGGNNVLNHDGISLLSLIGFALYIWTIFRMFSKNNEKRWEENRKYIELSSNWKTKVSQFIKRMKNRRDYKYFKCPNCKVLLRLKRGSGEKEITCVRCGFQFKQKS